MNNKVNLSNPKNKNYENYKDRVSTIIDKRAQEMYKDKSFADEYKGVYLTTEGIKLVCSILSAITVFVAVNWALSPLVGIAAPFIALLICGLLEILKTSIWTKLAKVKLKYKERALLLGMAAISLNLLSGSGSVFGAWQLPNMITPIERISTNLIDIDSIGDSYKVELTGLNGAISKLQNEIGKTSSNSTKRAISSNINKQAKQRESLFLVQQAAIKEATATNKERAILATVKHKAKFEANKDRIEIQQINCITFALLFELILIGCFMFGAYYLYRCEIDRTEGKIEGETVNDIETGTQMFKSPSLPHKAPTATTRTKIGFKTGNVLRSIDEQGVNEITAKTPNVSTQKEYDKMLRVGICSYVKCQQPFTYSNDSKQYCDSTCRGRAFRQRQKEGV